MKLYIFEEHHEVLPVWINHRSLLSSMKLLHVDYHSDMFVPTVRTPLPEWLRMGPTDLASTVCDELHINDFIIASAYLGLFNRIDWLRPTQIENALNMEGQFSNAHSSAIRSLSDFCLKSIDMTAQSKRNEGKEILVERTKHSKQPPPSKPGSDTRTFVWRILEARSHHSIQNTDTSVGSGAIFPPEQVVLDIEFDYFSCNPHPCRGKKLEISEREFKNYCNNPYHFLRLHYRTSAYENEDGYFIEFNPWFDEGMSDGIRSFEQIERAVKNFSAWLSMVRIEPTLITLCRAVQSGFCLPAEADLIEKLLLEYLDGLYNYSLC